MGVERIHNIDDVSVLCNQPIPLSTSPLSPDTDDGSHALVVTSV